jgi:ATP-dependent helicase HrpA
VRASTSGAVRAERDSPRLLYLQREDLMRHEAAGVTSEAFPHQLRLAGVDYELGYHFEPGSARDGVTLTVPLAQLNQIPAARCEWLVPGLLKEKVLQLVKTLPQRLRAKLVPVPDFAAEFVAQVQPADKPLVMALIAFILQSRGLNARGWEITPDAFRPDALPAHLAFNFRLLDENGRQLAMSRSLSELRAEWGREAKQEFSELHETPGEYVGMRDWTFGALPELMEVGLSGGQRVLGHPGLVDDGDSVSLTVFDSPEEARQAHRAGLLRLFMLQFREPLKYLEKNLPGLTQMAMQFMTLGTLDELRRQLTRSDRCAGLSARFLADRRGGFQGALRRGKTTAWPAGAGNLSTGRADPQRLAGSAEEAPGLQGLRYYRTGCRRTIGAVDRQAFHHRNTVRASAALSALSQGDHAAPGQAQGGR